MSNNLNGIKLWIIFFIFIGIVIVACTQKPEVAMGVGFAGVITMWMIHIIKSGFGGN